MSVPHKADIGVASAFVAWFVANLNTINGILQFIVLVLGIVGAIYGIARHRRKMRERDA
jgi:hypothetical protein